ncbi:hypothetical protein GCM10017744_009390 [Streptomyces antimycoticus]
MGPEDLVAVAMPRSAELVTALMAVLKAGAGYLPVDPEYPAARIAFMLEDARPALVLTTRELAAALPEALAGRTIATDDPKAGEALAGYSATDVTDDERARPLHPAHPAYTIYTSGSTGRPKGVVMPAGALANLLDWHQAQLRANRAPGWRSSPRSASTSPSRRSSPALLHGKTLVVCPEDVRRDPAGLARWLHDAGIKELYAPNLVIDAVCEAATAQGLELPDLTDLVQAGEALTPHGAIRTFCADRPGVRLHNHYGPAETHVVTACPLPADTDAWTPGPPPSGGPSTTRAVRAARPLAEPGAAGVPGELYITGAAWPAATSSPGPTAPRSGSSPIPTVRRAPGCTAPATWPASPATGS